MSSEEKLDQKIEAWRKKWQRKIRADLFTNRKTDLKAVFRAKRWEKNRSEKLEGRLFRVKEYHEAYGRCPTCCGTQQHPKPHVFLEYEHPLFWYSEDLDRFGMITGANGDEKKVISGQIVMATGEYLSRTKFDEPVGDTSKYVEILTENAVGFLDYHSLQQIKKSQVRELRKPKP